MVGEGRLSTSLLAAQRKDVDADPSLRLGQALRRHDDVEATVAPHAALVSQRISSAVDAMSSDARTALVYQVQAARSWKR
jgi:hypothetical protein